MLHREALELHAAPHANRGGSLNNLANAVETRFKQHGNPKDIDEAIKLHREALEIYAAPHPGVALSTIWPMQSKHGLSGVAIPRALMR
jgi:acyl carrier protein phosphodiesterase